MCSSASEPGTLLRMQDVGRCFPTPFGRVDAVRRANLSLSVGDFVAITGPSGSGKSTLLHLAALLDRPTSGRMLFDGVDVSALDDQGLCALRKRSVGMVFQRYCLLPHRSVFENVLFRFRYLDHERAEAQRLAAQALETVGLTSLSRRPTRLLSGGEMQRVAIARAIALRPRLLIADEPTGNLDGASSRVVMECFQSLNRAGITILMVTHNASILDFCSHRFACHDGCMNG